MRRVPLLVLALTAACAAAPAASTPPPPAPSPAVHVRVLDDEGRPLAGASAHRFGADGLVDLEVVATQPGELSVPLDGAAPIVKLGISAVNRKSELAFVATREAPVALEVRLGTYTKVPAKVDDVMVVVITSTGIGGLRDSVAVPGGFSVDPHRGEGTYRFAIEDRGGGAIVADGWMRVDRTMRAFVPFDREHLPPAGRPGRIDARGLTGELTSVLGRVPAATRFGEERLTRAKGDELRSTLARTALDASPPEVRRAAALACLSVPGEVATTGESRTLAAMALAVSPSDVLWSLADEEAFAHAAALLDEPFSGPRAQAFVKEQPDVDAVGRYLSRAMLEARRKPDEQRAILAAAQGRLARFREGLASEDPDRKTAPGKHLPDFDVTTREGKKVTSRGLAGRPWLIDFWSTSCHPCVRDAKHLEQAFATYARPGRPTPLGILSVTMDSADEVAAFRKEHPMPWQHALLDDGEATRLFTTLGLRAAFPTYILVGADGTILDASPALVGSDLPAVLERSLGAH